MLAGHCTLITIGNGQTANSLFSKSQHLIMDDIFETIRQSIYSFHMPLFVMLSGVVFVVSLPRLEQKSWVMIKARKLLIPYLTTALLLWIPIRWFVGYYGSNPDLFDIIINDLILGYDINYLWFLVMLFEVTFIMGMLSQNLWLQTKSKQIVLFVVLGIIWIIAPQLSFMPFQISRTCEFLIWFYLGMLLEMHRKKIVEKIKFVGWSTVLTGLIFMLLLICWFLVKNLLVQDNLSWINMLKVLKKGLEFIIAVAGCVSILFLAIYIAKKASGAEKSWIKRRTFQIYLYHVPCIYLFRWVIQKLLPVNMLTDSVFTLIVLAQFAIGLFGPWLIDTLGIRLKSIIIPDGIAQRKTIK